MEGMAESRRSFFLEECTKMATALARRPGLTADGLRAELHRVTEALGSEDVVKRLEAIEQLAELEPRVKSFVENER